jgi:signal transduction histidine kinase
MKRKLFFRPAARLQVVLSEELVSDPNVAVLEFVKNAYDAEATQTTVRFELGRRPADGRLLILDNGCGMDLAAIERNFMHPGFSEKAEAKAKPGSRVPIGEKGLGRLAAGRLGEQLDLYTRRGRNEPWLHLGFRWSDFNDMTIPLDKVPVWVDDKTQPPGKALSHGTVVVISQLRMRWDARVPGRTVRGRATTRLGRLRQDLELLLLPLLAADSGFDVDLEHNSTLPEDSEGSGAVKPPEMNLLDYQFDFELKRERKGWFAIGKVQRSQALAKRLGLKRNTPRKVAVEDLFDQPPKFDDLGPIKASVYYAPESRAKLEQIRAPVGVRLYRDGVRVDPYGEPGDDWLGVEAYKASRQGHAGIQPSALYGAVRISRLGNPELRPLANREGLLENEALQALLVFGRNELRWFGGLIQKEYREPERDKRRADRENEQREAEAVNVQRYAVAVTRAAVHAVRQPVAGAGAELYRLQQTLSRTPMPEDLRAQLQDLHDRTKQHLEQIDASVERLMKTLDFDPTPREIRLDEIVQEVIEKSTVAARSKNIRLINRLNGEQTTLVVPPGLLERSLEELIDNAVQARRPPDRMGQVIVQAHREDSSVRVSVIDNGTGIEKSVAERLFRESVSTEGHIGVGLLFNRQLLALARGDMRLVSTSSEGSQFDIVLPT